jgi:hypothetical protein
MIARRYKKTGSIVALLILMSPVGQVMGAEEGCAVEGENYIQDPDFSLEAEDSRSKYWSGLQHAGERSFETAIHGDVLTITKIATQPWYIYRQKLMNKDDFAGKKMAFSAEFKLSQQQAQHIVAGSGLLLNVLSGAVRESYRVNMPEDYIPDSDEWQLLQVVVQVPKKVRQIQLGFMHEAEGSLQVRRPSFRELDESKNTCALTPSS